jgi:hypothetical protein
MTIETGKNYTYKQRARGGKVKDTHSVKVTDIKPQGRGHTVTYTKGKSTLTESLTKFSKAVA